MSNNGPTFTKATYDGKRTRVPTRVPASSPERRQVAQAQLAEECANTKALNVLPCGDRIAALVAMAKARKK
jgi:hypothetical protein